MRSRSITHATKGVATLVEFEDRRFWWQDFPNIAERQSAPGLDHRRALTPYFCLHACNSQFALECAGFLAQLFRAAGRGRFRQQLFPLQQVSCPAELVAKFVNRFSSARASGRTRRFHMHGKQFGEATRFGPLNLVEGARLVILIGLPPQNQRHQILVDGKLVFEKRDL